MIEVLKQALEALECALSEDKPYIDECKQAITSLRQAIKELESQEPFGIWHQGATDEESDFYLYSESGDVSCPTCIKLYTTPPQRTEPIQSLQCFHCQVTIETLNDKVMQLMSQRTWVGLTDEEIAQGYETTGHYQTLRPQDKFAVYALARAIEAKLKEKNNG